MKILVNCQVKCPYLVLFVEAGRAFVALELSLGMQIEVLNVLFLIQEAFSTLTALVGFDTVNTDHMGSELREEVGAHITDITRQPTCRKV